MNSTKQGNHNARIFAIDSQDRLSILAAGQAAAEATDLERFQSARQFEALANNWPSSRLVRIWNTLPGVKPVKKFTDRKTAVNRIWNIIQGLQTGCGDQPFKTPSDSAKTTVHRQPTKAAQILNLLRQPFGSSLQQLMTATGWQAHTVRGFLSRQVRKKLGLRLKSFRRNGERFYSVRS